MIKTIHIFRHGLTDWNLAKRMQGHSDIPLNHEGRQQAEALQVYFEANPVDLFFSSDLQRAVETAKIANLHLKKPFYISEGLREAHLGALEGLTLEEANEKFGKELWEKWTSQNTDHFDFSYPGGETSNQVIERLNKTIQNLCKESDFIVAGLCTHGFAMRRFLHSLNKQLPHPLPIPNCVVYKISWDGKAGQFHFSI